MQSSDALKKEIPKIPAILRKYSTMENIASELDEEDLTEISQVVINGVRVDEDSRTEWLGMLEKIYKVALYDGETKNTPWEKASNVKIPLILTACVQFNARTNPEIVRENKVVEMADMGEPSTDERESRSTRTANYMNFQLLGESENWLSDTDRLLMILPMIGLTYRKSYWDNFKRLPTTDLCLPEDVVVNNNIKSLETASRITHIIYLNNNDLISNMRAGIFTEYSLDELTTSGEVDINQIENFGVSQGAYIQPAETFSTDEEEKNIQEMVHECYEQHAYLDLDGDGYQEPYIITVHAPTQKILRIVARYDVDDILTNAKSEVIKIKAKNYFTDYHFIPSLDGTFHSMGYGMMLAPINSVVNTTTNQLLDAATLANMPSGFFGKDFRVNSRDMKFKPGEWKPMRTANGLTIQQNIVPLPAKEPSPTLFTLMQFMNESGKQLASVTDILQGNVPNPNTAATTVMAMIEQGTKVYSSILYRIYNSLKKEFTKLYELNKKYITEEQEFFFANKLGMISPEDFKMPNYAIFPVANPAMSSDAQRMAQAELLVQSIQDPNLNARKIRELWLKTLNISDPEQYLSPPPDPNAPPPPEVKKTLAEANKLDKEAANTEMNTAKVLMDTELEALKLRLQQHQQKVDTYYKGSQITKNKMDSIADLTKAASQATPREILGSAKAEQMISLNAMPQEVLLTLDALNNKIKGLESAIQQKAAPQQQPIPPQAQTPNIQTGAPAAQIEGPGPGIAGPGEQVPPIAGQAPL